MTHTYRTLVLFALFPGTLMGPSAFAENPTRTIEIHAKRYAFEPAEITLTKGETVQIKLISDDVPHSLLISDLGINEAATKSHPAEAILTARDIGDFHGRCGRFCGSGHGHMLFTVHVVGK
jgi:cytochrome c oxidase subunit II